MVGRLLEAGFTEVGAARLDDGRPVFELVDAAASAKALYAITADDMVKFVGKSVGPLRKTLASFSLLDISQQEKLRVRRLIERELLRGASVRAYALAETDERSIGPFMLSIVDGLEDSVLTVLQPEWNRPADQPEKPKLTTAGGPWFEFTLGTAYWSQGFFNVSVSHERYFGKHNSRIDIYLGPGDHSVIAHVDRMANPNNTPRVMGGPIVKDWIHKNAKPGGVIRVEIIAPAKIRLMRAV